jgi:hypothetical protein
MLFADRFEAGLLLASKLGEFRNRDDVVVLALPRGGPAQKKLEIVPGATHLFEEPGALESVANLAANWFHIYLTGAGERTEAA